MSDLLPQVAIKTLIKPHDTLSPLCDILENIQGLLGSDPTAPGFVSLSFTGAVICACKQFIVESGFLTQKFYSS